MFHTNKFPISILAALDALAELGKTTQKQERLNQITRPKIFVSHPDQAIAPQDGEQNDK